MDWELYERQRATLLLVGVSLLSLLLFVFQQTTVVRQFRMLLMSLTLPTGRFLSQLDAPANAPHVPSPATETAALPSDATPATPGWAESAEHLRERKMLTDENRRLRDLVDLRDRRWPKAVAANVSGRDPQRWFQEIVLDKGREEGLDADDPVIAVVGGHEGLVGRITEVSPHVAKVMLIQDSLSAIAATVEGASGEDGVVEGTNSHDLFLRYLDRGSHLKIGDPVVTSGLGRSIPAGIPIGWVEEIELDPRQLFLQARLRSAVQSNRLHIVLVLTHRAENLAP